MIIVFNADKNVKIIFSNVVSNVNVFIMGISPMYIPV